ncbi:sulfatase-like hydrolase/transferase [Planctomycetota bacterium]
MKSARFNKIRLLFIFLILLLVIAGGVSWYLRGRQPPPIRNVILISIDTCRADHLGCYGFDRPTTPRIDAIANQGILFKSAFAPSPWTLPSHCSMLTGTYPLYHQIHDNNENRLDDSLLTLAEILQENDYATGGVIGSLVLDHYYGIEQGFDYFDEEIGRDENMEDAYERRGEEVSRLGIEFLDQHQNEPFFLFLHYFDPHVSYEPPEPFASRYTDDLYAGEIAYTDECIGRVLDHLTELGLEESTLLVIVGDHGESRGEHNESYHGYFIYQSTIHVPFIVKAGVVTESKQVTENVSLVDVFPTILGYLDVAIPEHVQGKDLSGRGRSTSLSEKSRKIYIESTGPTELRCNPLLGVVNEQWNYISTNEPELYDLHEDPHQLNNLVEQEPQRVRLMADYLHETMSLWKRAESVVSPSEFDSERLKVLETLGYIGSIFSENTLVIDPLKQDAKEMIQCNEYIHEVFVLMAQGQYAKARVLCEKIISEWPQVMVVYYLMTKLAYAAKEPEEVIKYGLQYLDLIPETSRGSIQTKRMIGLYSELILDCAIQLERYDFAATFCEQQLQREPDSPTFLNILGGIYFYQGRQEQAFNVWEKAIQINPDMAEAYENIGRAFCHLGDFDQAVTHLNQALRLNPDLVNARNDLMKISQLLLLDQSIAQDTEVLRRRPNDPVLHSKLAYAFYQKGDYEQAISHFREVIRIQPEEPEAYNNLAGLLVTTKDQELRNPAEAVRLAERAAELSQSKSAAILQTLSLAYAATNNYAEAISTAQKALKIATSEGNKAMAEHLRQRLTLLKSKRDGQVK